MNTPPSLLVQAERSEGATAVWLLNREIAREHARSIQTALASRLGVRRDQRHDVPVPGTLEHHPAPPRIRRLVVVSGAFHDPDALDAE